jgi:hypothetical protein
MTEREEAKREGLMEARAVVQRYQKANWRKLRVNDICDDIKRLIGEAAERAAEARQSPRISQADAALKAYHEGFAIRERLVAADRSNKRWQHDLAVSHSKLALVYEQQGRIADALQELTQGRDIMVPLVAIAPGIAQWKKVLAWFEQQIARLQGQARAQ